MKKIVIVSIIISTILFIASCSENNKNLSPTINTEVVNYDNDTIQKIAVDLVIKNQNLRYSKDTDDYSQEGKSFNVKVMPFGFDKNGRYEVRICPSYYPLSVLNYCYVDLKTNTVTIEP